ncbi:MAG: ABC transporter ATP-binding protein, partial [Clostridiales bacterium]|nr:ABC transporter ATP-binding protein [Clostridiales bacterium]
MPDKKKKKGLPFFGIPKMFPLLKRYKKSLALTGIMHVTMGLADVVRPLFQKYALDNFVQKGTLQNLGWFIAAYVLLVLAVGIIGYFSIATIMSVQLKMNRDMRNRAFAHLQEMSFDYYNQNSVGYIHARVMSDVGRIGEMFSWQFSDGIYFLFYILSAVVVMLSLNVKLTLMILMIVPVIAIFFSLFQEKMFTMHDEIREINSRITGNLNEGIIGAKTIKSLGIEKKMDEDFQAETANMKKKVIEYVLIHGSFSVMTNLASSCALAIVLWKGGVIAAENVGTFSVFMSYAQDLMEPVRWIVEVLGLLVMGQVNIGRYTKLVELESSVKDTPEVIEKYGDAFNPKKENWEQIKGDIEFKNVDFMYPDGSEYILRDFN